MPRFALVSFAVSCASAACAVPPASASVPARDEAAPESIGVCDLNAVAFHNATFNTQAQAQARCDLLVSQTFGDPADCRVVRLNNGKRQAQFRKLLQVKQLGLQALLQELAVFVQQFNLFGSNLIQVQAGVTNGCGS